MTENTVQSGTSNSTGKGKYVGMIPIILYQLALLAVYGFVLVTDLKGELPKWLAPHEQMVLCTLMGGLGGAVYCLRGVYLNACARKQWDISWWPWYFIRPIVSLCCGLVSFIFLRAGLLVLDAAEKQEANHLGYYALAFIAGLNVDKFTSKLEDIAHGVWGIERSRTAEKPEGKKE